MYKKRKAIPTGNPDSGVAFSYKRFQPEKIPFGNVSLTGSIHGNQAPQPNPVVRAQVQEAAAGFPADPDPDIPTHKIEEMLFHRASPYRV